MNAADDDRDDDDAQAARTSAALADAARLTAVRCRGCGTPVCGHEAVFALVLGYKDAPRCLRCTAAHMREPADVLRERALEYVQHHDCFHAAWRRASELEQSNDRERPACVWRPVPGVPPAAVPAATPTSVPHQRAAAAADPVAAVWDAGAMGCGDLVLELRLRLAALPPGSVLELRAEDPGAPVDLPAWCAMTGHALLEARHPLYLIRRRG